MPDDDYDEMTEAEFDERFAASKWVEAGPPPAPTYGGQTVHVTSNIPCVTCGCGQKHQPEDVR